MAVYFACDVLYYTVISNKRLLLYAKKNRVYFLAVSHPLEVAKPNVGMERKMEAATMWFFPVLPDDLLMSVKDDARRLYPDHLAERRYRYHTLVGFMVSASRHNWCSSKIHLDSDLRVLKLIVLHNCLATR